MKRCNYSAHRLWEVEGVRMELVVMCHISCTRKSLGQRLSQETRQLSDRSGNKRKEGLPSSQILDCGTIYGHFQSKRRDMAGGKAGNGRNLGFGPALGCHPSDSGLVRGVLA